MRQTLLTFFLIMGACCFSACGKKSGQVTDKVNPSNTNTGSQTNTNQNTGSDQTGDTSTASDDEAYYQEDLKAMAGYGYDVSGCPATYQELQTQLDAGTTISNCALIQ